MRVFSSPELLDTSDRGLSLMPYQRAMLLLLLEYPERDPDELWGLSIGERNRAILNLRRELFGEELSVKVVCEECGEMLDSRVNIDELVGSQTNDDDLHLTKDGYKITVRAPTSDDIDVVLGSGGDQTTRHLMSRCIVEATFNDAKIGPEIIPENLIEDIARSIASAEPLTTILLRMVCPACSHERESEFDVNEHLWNDLNEWAARTLDDVHALATAYGWSEREIMAMSPHRRAQYIERI